MVKTPAHLISVLGRSFEIVETALLHNICKLSKLLRRSNAPDRMDVDIRHDEQENNVPSDGRTLIVFLNMLF